MSTMNLPQCWQDFEDVMTAGYDRVILYGPPGTGKTFAGLNYGNIEGGAWRLQCTDDMTNADVTGHYIPNGERWEWKDGSAIKAWQGNGSIGGRLVIDEIDKAGGDVFATLLAMTDSVESAEWQRPSDGALIRPVNGFSVVMTTNIEDMDDLPQALKDRFPVAIRINRPHPSALMRLSERIRAYAATTVDAEEGRRISLRAWMAFEKLAVSHGDEKAARLVFGRRAEGILDAIKIDLASGKTSERGAEDNNAF